MPTSELKASLDKVWNIKGEWKLVTLGKGYFNIQLSDIRKRDKIFLRRSWPSEFGTMHVQKWMPKFKSYKISSPIVNVWACIFELPMEYFHVPIIEAIASALGPVVNIDKHTCN